MGQDTAHAASRALKLLNHPDMRHHPKTGPAERRSPSTTPGAPLNLDVVDHLISTVGELVDLTRQIAPTAGPIPAQIEGVYDWCVNSTGDADQAQQEQRDTVIERQRLEHAVRLGDHNEVCKHPCPRCGCWGLMWDDGGNRARCTNRRCRTADGLSSTWTLARLAAQKVQGTEIWRRNAT